MYIKKCPLKKISRHSSIENNHKKEKQTKETNDLDAMRFYALCQDFLVIRRKHIYDSKRSRKRKILSHNSQI